MNASEKMPNVKWTTLRAGSRHASLFITTYFIPEIDNSGIYARIVLEQNERYMCTVVGVCVCVVGSQGCARFVEILQNFSERQIL